MQYATWQPIDTHDGSPIAVLVYMAGTAGLGIYRAVFGNWGDGESRWRANSYSHIDEFAAGAKITHWMPLPEPPTVASTD